MHRFRKEIKALINKSKTSLASEREGMKDLTAKLLCECRRAQYLHQQGKKKDERRAQFIKDSYGFTKAFLGQPKSGILTSMRPEVEESLREEHSDSRRGQGLGVN